MARLVISADEANNIISGDYEGYTRIYDKIVDTTRWEVIHEQVFSLNGKFYMANYTRGATENQWKLPYEHDSEVDIVGVESYEKTVIDWRVKSV